MKEIAEQWKERVMRRLFPAHFRIIDAARGVCSAIDPQDYLEFSGGRHAVETIPFSLVMAFNHSQEQRRKLQAAVDALDAHTIGHSEAP